MIGLRATETLDPDVGFFQLGMDSLMSVTLQRRLSADLGIALPAALIYEYPTIASLTDALCERMGLATTSDSAADAADAPAGARSGLAARAQQRASARRGAQAGRRKGPVR